MTTKNVSHKTAVTGGGYGSIKLQTYLELEEIY